MLKMDVWGELWWLIILTETQNEVPRIQVALRAANNGVLLWARKKKKRLESVRLISSKLDLPFNWSENSYFSSTLYWYIMKAETQGQNSSSAWQVRDDSSKWLTDLHSYVAWFTVTLHPLGWEAKRERELSVCLFPFRVILAMILLGKNYISLLFIRNLRVKVQVACPISLSYWVADSLFHLVDVSCS